MTQKRKAPGAPVPDENDGEMVLNLERVRTAVELLCPSPNSAGRAGS